MNLPAGPFSPSRWTAVLFAAAVVASLPFARADEKPVSFSYAGPFTPQEGQALSHTEDFKVPAGQYAALHLEMDVTAGAFPQQNPKAKLNLFWMVKSHRNPDMFGYCAISRPTGGPAQLMLRQGVGVPHVKKTKDIQDVTVVEGHTYHVSYDYDVAAGHAVLVLAEKGKELARLTSTPLVQPPARAITFGKEDRVTIDLSTKIGDKDPTAAEAPSLGWTYRDLKVTLRRAD